MKSEKRSTANPFAGRGWIRQGIYFGLFMFVANTALDYFLFDQPLPAMRLLKLLPLWLACGLVYSYIMKLATPSD